MIKLIKYLLLAVCLLYVSGVSAAVSPYSAIEVTGNVGINLNAKQALALCKKYQLPASSVYQWNNHLVLYGELKRPSLLQHELAGLYPDASVKTYQNPFYIFNRKQRCGNSGLAAKWDNIILTANLVADPKLQQEYLNYHATQFQKWPEVSNGFCNAQFQQLLVFKSGRQLMLIISIPKGENLDKLNPLTSKNNPRVNEWNKLMSKYQEGLPGTKKGEVWVFLRSVGSF